MQLELTLISTDADSYSASDLGYLLHKNPSRVFSRTVSAGIATVFYSEVSESRCTAVLHVDVDPVALVRGKNKQSTGLLDQYVNTRPYVANSILSVSINKCFAQTMAGKSKDRQSLAEKTLPFEALIGPIVNQGDENFVLSVFEPLGYACKIVPLNESADNKLVSIKLTAAIQLSEMLNHLYVLIPVLDDAKHWWVDQAEVENLFNKGAHWLAKHPMRDIITRRALKHRRELSDELLNRLTVFDKEPDELTFDSNILKNKPNNVNTDSDTSSKPVRLHDQRLDRVASLLQSHSVSRVLDLGCGEGKLISRLLKTPQFTSILGVDPSLRALRRAREYFYLDDAGEALNERLQFQLGSLTYADRRLRGFDAATLVEVIEHIDPNRLASLERSLFGDARPSLIIITTPNSDYNAMFESLPAGDFRHDDHRFEWTRDEFKAWCERVSSEYGYRVEIEPLGDVDGRYGAVSQLGCFVIDASSDSIGVQAT